MKLTPKTDFKVFFAMIIVLVLPAGLTLLRVEKARELVGPPFVNTTPLGYTWSLLLFIIPALAIVTWLHVTRKEKFLRKSFWITIAALIPLGFLLDIFLGSTFFTFKNHEATLQIHLPGFDLLSWCWAWNLPIEEFGFYTSGFVAILLIYIWCDEYWLNAYNVPDYSSESKEIKRIIVLHPQSLILGFILIIIAVIYKKFIAPDRYHEGFPGYFTFLVFTAILPSFIFFRTANRFINWRAFSITFFFIFLISLIWEGTLGLPYQWWGYKDGQLIGLTIGAWSSLPIEEIILWMGVTFTTIIVYEVIKIWLHSRRKAVEVFFGEGESSLSHSCKAKLFNLKKILQSKKIF